MDKILVAYTAYTFDNRIELVIRYETIFAARDSTRKALKHFAAHGLRCRLHYHYVEPKSGGFEVGIVFAKGIDEDSVIRAATQKPPLSNRGVTQ